MHCLPVRAPRHVVVHAGVPCETPLSGHDQAAALPRAVRRSLPELHAVVAAVAGGEVKRVVGTAQEYGIGVSAKGLDGGPGRRIVRPKRSLVLQRRVVSAHDHVQVAPAVDRKGGTGMLVDALGQDGAGGPPAGFMIERAYPGEVPLIVGVLPGNVGSAAAGNNFVPRPLACAFAGDHGQQGVAAVAVGSGKRVVHVAGPDTVEKFSLQLLSSFAIYQARFAITIGETLSPRLRRNCHPEEAWVHRPGNTSITRQTRSSCRGFAQADEGSTAAWNDCKASGIRSANKCSIKPLLIRLRSE